MRIVIDRGPGDAFWPIGAVAYRFSGVYGGFGSVERQGRVSLALARGIFNRAACIAACALALSSSCLVLVRAFLCNTSQEFTFELTLTPRLRFV